MKRILLIIYVLAQAVLCKPGEDIGSHKEVFNEASKVGFIEITSFKLKPNESTESFKESAVLMQKDFLEKQKGFSKRTLILTTDSKWIDVVYWTDKESFEMAMKNSKSSKLATQFLKKIDPDSINMKFVNLNREQGMDAIEWETWILKEYPGIIVLDAYKERSFFYNPNGTKPKGIYFATIKESDGPNDKASNLDREGVYRLSIGIGKNKYKSLFGDIPPRPVKGQIIDLDIDFHEMGKLTPHPIYAWLGWVGFVSIIRKKVRGIGFVIFWIFLMKIV